MNKNNSWVLEGNNEEEVPKEESTIGSIGRNVARSVVNAATTAIGLPGSFLNIGEQSRVENANKPSSSGIEHTRKKLLAGLSPSNSEIGWLAKTNPGNLMKGAQAVTGEALKPKNSTEEWWDDVVSDVTASLVPGGGLSKKMAVGAAVGGNIASWITGELGGGKTAKDISKLGFNLLMPFAGSRKALKKIEKNSYAAADALVSPKTVVSSKALESDLNQLSKKLEFGKDTAGKQLAREQISEIKSKISKNKVSGISESPKGSGYYNYAEKGGHKISIAEFRDMKRGINKIKYDLPEKSSDAEYWLNKINKSINDHVFKPYGEKNIDWYQNFMRGEDIATGMLNASKVNKFLAGNMSLKELLKKESLAKHLLLGAGIVGTGYVGGPVAASKVLGVGLGVREFVKNIDLLRGSSVARKYYKNTINAALKNDVKLAATNITKLNKALEKEQVRKSPNAQYVLE